MVNCSVVKKLMVLGKWPYLMVFGQMTFSLGCLPAASQLASARHLPKPLKITFALSSINCYEVKTPKIVNGKRANVFICLSSINRPYSLHSMICTTDIPRAHLSCCVTVTHSPGSEPWRASIIYKTKIVQWYMSFLIFSSRVMINFLSGWTFHTA